MNFNYEENKYLYIIVAIIIILLILCSLSYLYNLSFGKKNKEGYTNIDSKYGKSLNQTGIKLFHSNGCGHCVQFMPEWSKFEDYVKSTRMDIRVEKINCSEEPFLCENLVGVPTVKLYRKSGEIIEMSGYPRTKEGIMKFIKENN